MLEYFGPKLIVYLMKLYMTWCMLFINIHQQFIFLLVSFLIRICIYSETVREKGRETEGAVSSALASQFTVTFDLFVWILVKMHLLLLVHIYDTENEEKRLIAPTTRRRHPLRV